MSFHDFSWRSLVAIVDILKRGGIITQIVWNVLHVPGCRSVLHVVIGLKVHGFLPIREGHTPTEGQWWRRNATNRDQSTRHWSTRHWARIHQSTRHWSTRHRSTRHWSSNTRHQALVTGHPVTGHWKLITRHQSSGTGHFITRHQSPCKSSYQAPVSSIHAIGSEYRVANQIVLGSEHSFSNEPQNLTNAKKSIIASWTWF